MPSITLNDISDLENLIKAGATIVSERKGIRKSAKLQQKPFWKRRFKSDNARLRKDLSRLDDWFKGKWKKDKRKRRIKEEYGIKIKLLKSLLRS